MCDVYVLHSEVERYFYVGFTNNEGNGVSP